MTDSVDASNSTIRLPDLVGSDLPAMITRCQFENCELLGPAVLLIVGGVTVENSSFDGPGTFLTVDTDREYFGMIGVSDTKFINCVFRNVGIAAGQDTINEFLADVLPRD